MTDRTSKEAVTDMLHQFGAKGEACLLITLDSGGHVKTANNVSGQSESEIRLQCLAGGLMAEVENNHVNPASLVAFLNTCNRVVSPYLAAAAANGFAPGQQKN